MQLRMKKQILIAILPLVFAASCKTTKKNAADTANTALILIDDSFRKAIVDKEIFKNTIESIPLDTVYLTKDSLNIITKKITGCETENFKLIWNGELGKTSPPTANLKLFQLVDGACREKHKFHLIYNISPLKLKGDTATVKTTQINIGGWGKTSAYTHN